MKWRRFIPLVIGFYIVLNIFFAFLYYIIGMDQFMGTLGESKWDAFQEALKEVQENEALKVEEPGDLAAVIKSVVDDPPFPFRLLHLI